MLVFYFSISTEYLSISIDYKEIDTIKVTKICGYKLLYSLNSRAVLTYSCNYSYIDLFVVDYTYIKSKPISNRVTRFGINSKTAW